MKIRPLYSWILVLCLTCLSCATTSVPKIKAGEKPAPETDEAGIWMVMDRVEQNLKTSGRIETDPDLNAYVRRIICRLDPDICDDIRFYIVKTPYSNASMAPNGFMQIWTGLMLRARNEAQLAYVLGHELAHYQHRHTLERWRTLRNTTTALAFLQIASFAAGAGTAGDMVTFAAIFSLLAYTRDQEREADDVGFDLIADAGYDYHGAADFWEASIEEQKASGEPDTVIFLATHPATSERIKTLREMADILESHGIHGKSYQREYSAAIRPFRAKWLKAELRKRDFAASQVVLKYLFINGDNPCELQFYQGELYRMRDQEGDQERAIASYQKALSCEHYPPAALRSLGLLFWKTRKLDAARESFQNYLVADPAAPDVEMIKSYLEEIQSND
jgi:predicted Zn-dependent protease